MTLDHLIHELDPKIIERARRLQTAIQLINEGRGRSECAALIRARYPVSRYTAWRVVAIAWDMAGEIEVQK
jgi:hypothetical protein